MQEINKPIDLPKTQFVEDVNLQNYDHLVNNIASLCVMQCNLYSNKVPDSITQFNKPKALLGHVLEKLKGCLKEAL